MTNLVESPSFDDIRQLETTDLALAGSGPGQIMNLQAQAFLNRWAYLASAAGASKVGNSAIGTIPAGTLLEQLSALYALANADSDGSYGNFTQLSVPADGTVQIAGSGALNGTYMVRVSGSNREQFLIIHANGQPFGTNVVSVAANHAYTGQIIATNIRIVASADNANRYLVMDIGNRNGAAVTLTVTAIGPRPQLALTLTPGGSTASTNVISSFVSPGGNMLLGSQTDGGQKLQVTGAALVSGDLAVNGTMLDSTAAEFTAFLTPVTLNLGGTNTQNLNLAQRAGSQTLNLGTLSTSNSVYNFATGPTASGSGKGIAIGTGGLAGSNTAITLGAADGNGTITLNHDTTVKGTLAVNPGTITAATATGNLFNATATTVNLGGAATALNMGAATGTAIIGNPTVLGSQATQNLWNSVATTINFATAATSLNIGAVTTTSTINLGTGAIASGQTQTINIGTGGAAGSVCNVNLGPTAGGGSVNINNNFIASTGGSVIGAAGTLGNVTTGDNLGLTVTDSGFSAGNGGMIQFAAQNAATNRHYAAIKGLLFSGAGNSRGHLAFSTRNADADSTLTERMRLLSSGEFLVGRTSVQANGGFLQVADGISFPATQVARTDPNTLDDYEEGTFTPSVAGATTPGTATYSVRVGSYTKTGRLVTCQIVMTYTGGTGAGNLLVTGLPFAIAGTIAPVASVGIYGGPTFTGSVHGLGASTQMEIRGSVSGASFSNAVYTAAGTIVATVTYEV